MSLDTFAAVQMLRKRLANYPGPRQGELWKLDRDLTHCTEREKEELKTYGLTVSDMMRYGFRRGEVHHVLFGYKFTAK